MPGLPGFAENSTPDDWDLGVGKVVGYRSWDFRRHRVGCPSRSGMPSAWRTCHCSSGLFGNWGQHWETRQMTARCESGNYYLDRTTGMREYTRCERVLDHPENCGCGIWAYWQLPNHEPSMRHLSGDAVFQNLWPVAGRIEGSGRVVIGQKGFRCEKAKLTDLVVWNHMPNSAVEELMAQYPEVNVIRANKGSTPFFNPAAYALHRQTEVDVTYGPHRGNQAIWRKVIRVITGF